MINAEKQYKIEIKERNGIFNEGNWDWFIDLDVVGMEIVPKEDWFKDLEVFVCPVCGNTMITMKEIRQKNLWYTQQEFKCNCGWNKIVYLWSHAG